MDLCMYLTIENVILFAFHLVFCATQKKDPNEFRSKICRTQFLLFANRDLLSI